MTLKLFFLILEEAYSLVDAAERFSLKKCLMVIFILNENREKVSVLFHHSETSVTTMVHFSFD